MLLLVVAPILGAPDKPSCSVITPCCGDVIALIQNNEIGCIIGHERYEELAKKKPAVKRAFLGNSLKPNQGEL